MNFQYISYALSVKKYGSFSNAAKEMYISQPALSKAIKRLESDIGFSLFDRTADGITVTKKGNEFFKQVTPVIEQYYQIEEFYKNTSNETLSVEISSSDSNIFSTAFSDLMLAEKLEQYSKIRFRETNFEDLCHSVANQNSSIGLIHVPSVIAENVSRFLEYSHLKLKVICSNSIYALTSKKNPHIPHSLEHIAWDPDCIGWLKKCIYLKNYSHLYYHKTCGTDQIETNTLLSQIEFKQEIDESTCLTKYQVLSKNPDCITFSSHTVPELREKFDLIEFPCEPLGEIYYGYVFLEGYQLSEFEQKLIERIRQILKED